MRDRERDTAKRFGVLDRIESLEKSLLEINHVVDVEFDLDGFYDDIRQVIIVPKYNISVKEPNYFGIRDEMLEKILEVAKSYGLKFSGDRIEDHGEHLYIVRDCDMTWQLHRLNEIDAVLANASQRSEACKSGNISEIEFVKE